MPNKRFKNKLLVSKSCRKILKNGWRKNELAKMMKVKPIKKFKKEKKVKRKIKKLMMKILKVYEQGRN